MCRDTSCILPDQDRNLRSNLMKLMYFHLSLIIQMELLENMDLQIQKPMWGH